MRIHLPNTLTNQRTTTTSSASTIKYGTSTTTNQIVRSPMVRTNPAIRFVCTVAAVSNVRSGRQTLGVALGVAVGVGVTVGVAVGTGVGSNSRMSTVIVEKVVRVHRVQLALDLLDLSIHLAQLRVNLQRLFDRLRLAEEIADARVARG